MRLNITTDYAIRIILYLSMKGGIISSKELSGKLCFKSSKEADKSRADQDICR